jgi:hypothetical protein
MKVFLLCRDHEVDVPILPANEEILTRDLELNVLLEAMARGDKFLFEVAKGVLLSSLLNPGDIIYRQGVLADCLAHSSIVAEIYGLAIEAIEGEKAEYIGFVRNSPESIVRRSVRVLQVFVGILRRMRRIADEHAHEFRSEGFVRFFAMLCKELDEGYLSEVDEQLKELAFRRGVFVSASLARGGTGANYVLRARRNRTWKDVIPFGAQPNYTFVVAPRNDASFRALSGIKARALNPVANAVAQSADHVLSFFTLLRTELAFYVGCLNLHQRLSEKGEPTCFPIPQSGERPILSARGLYDTCLSLIIGGRAIGNDIDASGKSLVMVTGANQGGKSTFLRSAGLAQLMMQSGMFASAEWLTASVCNGVFTHFKREEDASMEKGKLDEEMSRMRDIAQNIRPGCLLLCNESFAATNEREGSEIARQVVRALTESGVRVIFVTHLFDLAHGFYAGQTDAALFLRAERGPEGQNTFRVIEGEPQPTSYGEVSYRRIFG